MTQPSYNVVQHAVMPLQDTRARLAEAQGLDWLMQHVPAQWHQDAALPLTNLPFLQLYPPLGSPSGAAVGPACNSSTSIRNQTRVSIVCNAA